jgi:hypothetical protein
MTIDISKDYEAWDNTEVVRCRVNEDGDPQRQVAVDNALRISPSNKFSSYSGVQTSSDQTTFWLPINQFGAKKPDMNMVLKDANDVLYNVASDARKITYGTSSSHWDVLVTQQQEEC